MDDKDVSLLKDVEQTRKKEKEFNEQRMRNEEFIEASQSPYFTLFNTVIGAVSAVVSVIVVEVFLWKTSKWLFWIITVLLALSMLFRMISKYYYMRGKQKRFETFNKLSKVTGVASSVADATILKGSKATASSSKAGDARDKVSGAIETLVEMQFNGGVYVDVKYDYVRERCRRMGSYIRSTQDTSYIENLYTSIYKEVREAKMTKASTTFTKMMILYVKDKLAGSYVDDEDNVYSSAIGALYFYREPFKELANSLPLVGYKDNVFSIFCVYAGNREVLDKYSNWKLNSMRQNVISKHLEDSDKIWTLMVSKGETAINVNTILDEVIDKLNNCDINPSSKELANTFCKMLYHSYEMEFDKLSEEEYRGILGSMIYFIEGKLEITNLTDADGYMDLEVLLRCCELKCKDTLEEFNKWQLVYSVLKENDPLSKYLDITIGDSEDDRMTEIRRLSKLCTDAKVDGLYNRARHVIERKFHTGEFNIVIPSDMHEWAVSKGITDREAVDVVYSYMPKVFRDEKVDDVQIAIRYWNKYKYILEK